MKTELIKRIHWWGLHISIFVFMSLCMSYIRSDLLQINYNGFYVVSSIKYAMYPYVVVIGGYFFYFRVDTVVDKIIIISLIAFFIFLQHFILRYLFC